MQARLGEACSDQVCFLTVCTPLLEMGAVRIRFFSVDSLKKAKDDKRFVTMVESLNCIKVIANVRASNEIVVLMEFMNSLRKVSAKHIIIKIPKLTNIALLEQISINYEVNMHEGNTGFTNFTSYAIYICHTFQISYMPNFLQVMER